MQIMRINKRTGNEDTLALSQQLIGVIAKAMNMDSHLVKTYLTKYGIDTPLYYYEKI